MFCKTFSPLLKGTCWSDCECILLNEHNRAEKTPISPTGYHTQSGTMNGNNHMGEHNNILHYLSGRTTGRLAELNKTHTQTHTLLLWQSLCRADCQAFTAKERESEAKMVKKKRIHAITFYSEKRQMQ